MLDEILQFGIVDNADIVETRQELLFDIAQTIDVLFGDDGNRLERFDDEFILIGECLYKGEYYAAHRTLPLPCMVRITNLTTGKSVEARVADRGPFVHNRLIDVSSAVARDLGFTHKGLDRVRVEVLSVGDGQYRVKK